MRRTRTKTLSINPLFATVVIFLLGMMALALAGIVANL